MCYFANSTEGMVLDEQCLNCFYLLDTEDRPTLCPVHSLHLSYNSEQLKNQQLRDALNVLVNENGVCQVKKLVDKIRLVRPEDPGQGKLF